eukprot:Skav201526  [mRNA]  locus=scaffold3018:24318:35986:+ [translate_table: standard]
MAKIPQLPNLPGVLCLCAGMTLLFTAFQEVQNAAPVDLEEVRLGNFGYYALATFYCGMLCGSQVAPGLIHCLGGRRTLPIAAVGFLFFMGSLLVVGHINGVAEQFSLAVAAVVLISALSGLVGGLLWPSQGYVLTHYAPPHLLNWYMSLFSLCFFASGFLGPALVAPIIKFAGQHSVAIPLTLFLLAVLGCLLLCCLPATVDANGQWETPKSAPASPPRSAAALFLLCEAPARRLGILAFAEGWGLNAYVPAMLPVMASTATGGSSPLSVDKELLQLMLLLNGVGHIFASLLYAPMADRFGRRFMLTFQGSMALVALLLAELDVGLFGTLDLPSTALRSLDLSAAFFLGFSTILGRTNNNAICGNLYRERAGSAFALLAALRSIGSIAGILLMPSISGEWPKEIIAASLGFLFAASICAAAYPPLFAEAEARGCDLEEPED